MESWQERIAKSDFGIGRRVTGKTCSVPRYDLPFLIPFDPHIANAQLAFDFLSFKTCCCSHAITRHCGLPNARTFRSSLSYRPTKVLGVIKGAAVAEAWFKALMAHAYGVCGKRAHALKVLDEITVADIASPYLIAGVYAALGDRESAFEWLAKEYDPL